MDQQTKLELEAAAFRGLVEHLQNRTDVQNIDLMNLAGFCRNCLAKWYKAAANERAVELSMEDAKEQVYGMPFALWKDTYQTKATDAQVAQFQDTSGHAVIKGL